MSNLVRNVFVGLSRPQNSKNTAFSAAASAVVSGNLSKGQSQLSDQAIQMILQQVGPQQPAALDINAFPQDDQMMVWNAHAHLQTCAVNAQLPHTSSQPHKAQPQPNNLNLNMPAFQVNSCSQANVGLQSSPSKSNLASATAAQTVFEQQSHQAFLQPFLATNSSIFGYGECSAQSESLIPLDSQINSDHPFQFNGAHQNFSIKKRPQINLNQFDFNSNSAHQHQQPSRSTAQQPWIALPSDPYFATEEEAQQCEDALAEESSAPDYFLASMMDAESNTTATSQCAQSTTHDQDCLSPLNQSTMSGNKDGKQYTDSFKVKYKTEMCKNFTEHGFCEFKNHCSFAHGVHELKQKTNMPKNYKTKLCKKYHQDHFCPYGDRCQFLHDEPQSCNNANSSSQESKVQGLKTKQHGQTTNTGQQKVVGEKTMQRSRQFRKRIQDEVAAAEPLMDQVRNVLDVSAAPATNAKRLSVFNQITSSVAQTVKDSSA